MEQQGQLDRAYWLGMLKRVAEPVLKALAERRLKADMPVEQQEGAYGRERFAHLEAFGRTMTGIAPWMESGAAEGEEGELRKRFIALALAGVDAATDPSSPDYMNFGDDYQPIVDAAFLSHALLRAPKALLEPLRRDERVRANLVQALQATRSRKPWFNNWLLFAAMIECALERLGAQADPMRIDYALRQHEQWYLGDGVYGDGPEFHFDYYNSFVILPMLVDILELVGDRDPVWSAMRERVRARAVRHAAIQERLIAPDGSFPPIGRSLVYRSGSFQLLAQIALRGELPPEVAPAQVRGALTAVLCRTLEAPDTFDTDGWLRIGLAGHQPGLGETYICTGSLYLCSASLLPLGLPPSDPFWSGEAVPWTSQRAWGGLPVPIDTAFKG